MRVTGVKEMGVPLGQVEFRSRTKILSRRAVVRKLVAGWPVKRKPSFIRTMRRWTMQCIS